MQDFTRARSEEQKRQRMQEIKTAAETLFKEHPYHEITLTTIAEQLSWTRANLYKYSSWKRFRKYNAYATGISQDIQDYLDNPVAYALLSNSEFVIMLRQSKSLEALERLYGLSKPQLEFLRNASEGHGIIKMGNGITLLSNR